MHHTCTVQYGKKKKSCHHARARAVTQSRARGHTIARAAGRTSSIARSKIRLPKEKSNLHLHRLIGQTSPNWTGLWPFLISNKAYEFTRSSRCSIATMVCIDLEMEPFAGRLDLTETALIIIDMQVRSKGFQSIVRMATHILHMYHCYFRLISLKLVASPPL
jgi:hypothetical protein